MLSLPFFVLLFNLQYPHAFYFQGFVLLVRRIAGNNFHLPSILFKIMLKVIQHVPFITSLSKDKIRYFKPQQFTLALGNLLYTGTNSLRSKRFHGVSEQKKSEERDFRSFSRPKNGARGICRAKNEARAKNERFQSKNDLISTSHYNDWLTADRSLYTYIPWGRFTQYKI